MTDTFEVGQKVTVLGTGEGEIVYGPVDSSFQTYRGYVVKVASGDRWYKTADLKAVPDLPTFAVGDKVVHRTFGPGEVAFGPFKHTTEPAAYLMRDEDGTHSLAMADALTKATDPKPIKVGDRVRVTRNGRRDGDRHIGRVGTVVVVDEFDDRLPYRVNFDDEILWWCAEVARVEDESTYTHDGITYDPSAKYRDRDGDIWHLRVNPEHADEVQAQMTPIAPAGWGHYTLTSLVDTYGPLTRI